MKRFKMSYSNGLLSESKTRFAGGKNGKDGLPGVGFKLTSSGDFDLQKKRLTNVADGTTNSDAITKQQINSKVDKVMTDHLDTNYKEIKNVSRGTDSDAFPLIHGKSIFLTVNGNKFDAKNQQIINVVTDTTNNTSAVNVSALNRAVASAGSAGSSSSITANIDLKDQFNVINSKQRNLSQLKTHYDSLVSYEEVNRNFLSKIEEYPMETQLNMNHNSITNLKDPIYAHEAATKGYADKKLSLAGGRMTNSINMGNNEITNLATPTGNNNASTKKYVDDVDAKVRSNMAKEVVQILGLLDKKIDIGEIDQKTEKIVNLGTPSEKK